ncbi:MAG: hypothetical protein ABII06_08795, partial [Pseudomonadota bacterium]
MTETLISTTHAMGFLQRRFEIKTLNNRTLGIGSPDIPTLKALFSARQAPPGHVIFLTFFPVREDVDHDEILSCGHYVALRLFRTRGLWGLARGPSAMGSKISGETLQMVGFTALASYLLWFVI